MYFSCIGTGQKGHSGYIAKVYTEGSCELTIQCNNVVCYMMTLQSDNHTVIRIANTMQCRMIHQLVWYGHVHFIFYSEQFVKLDSWRCYAHYSSAIYIMNHDRDPMKTP